MTDKELHTVSVCVCVLVQMCVWLGVWMGGGGGGGGLHQYIFSSSTFSKGGNKENCTAL